MAEKIAFLMDYSPRYWSSLDSCHLHLCRALKKHNVESILIYSKAGNSEATTPVFKQHEVDTLAISYAEGVSHYYRQLGRLINEQGVTTVHVEFFNYFSLIPWLARLNGLRHIIFTEYTSGLWEAKSWK